MQFRVVFSRLSGAFIIGCILSVSVSPAAAATLDYNSVSNIWTFDGFGATGVGSFTRLGSGGLAGDGPHTRSGKSVTFGWNISQSGGWLYYDQGGASESYTDFWWTSDFSFRVTGARWTNNPGPITASGGFGLGTSQLLLGTAIAQGTLLDGTFSYIGDPQRPYVIYTPTSPIPIPAAAWLFGSALLGFLGLRRKTATANQG